MPRHTNRDTLKDRILQTAASEFRLHGIKAVKMDDIAAKLKISKRTLYEVYDNKRDILFDVLVFQGQKVSTHMRDFMERTNNVMDILIEFFRLQTEAYAATNPVFMTDLAKYPDLMERLHEYSEESHHRTESFLRRGVEEEYFLDNVNYKLLARICHNSLRDMASDVHFDALEMREIFYSFIFVIIRGFCTQKGLTRLDEFISELRKKAEENKSTVL